MHLSVVVRTCDRLSLRGERYTGTPKSEVTYRCLFSLVQALRYAIVEGVISLDQLSLVVVDDHSDHPEIIRTIVSGLVPDHRFESISGTGNNASLERYFALGARSPDVVYFVEDDYLHAKESIAEMLQAKSLFQSNLGRPVAILPNDDPDNYQPHTLKPSYIVMGTGRHWRTTEWSLCTFLLDSDIVRTHWELFFAMALGYERQSGVHEGSTFGQIWSRHAMLFAPVPTLALHVQTDKEKDPYIDWRIWWNDSDYRPSI